MVDEAQWTKLVQDNTNAIAKNTEVLKEIRDEFKLAIEKYHQFSEKMTQLEMHMKYLTMIAVGIFSSLLVGMALYVLTK